MIEAIGIQSGDEYEEKSSVRRLEERKRKKEREQKKKKEWQELGKEK